MLRCRFALALVILVNWGIGKSALANTEMIVASIHDGQHPYMVVIPDTEGSSTRQPGIYYSTKIGKWEQLILGDVLTGGSHQGIISQLVLTKEDKRYASLAVVDGKLKLFQMNADKISDKSIITLGEGDAQTFDVHGNEVILPEIRSVDDIVIREGTTASDGQTVVISIRSQQPTFLGDGVTLAFFVKKGHPDLPDEIKLGHAPIVVDYKYLSFEKLNYIINGFVSSTKGRTVFSRLALISSARNLRNDDCRPLLDWKQTVKNIADNFYNLSYSVEADKYPVINLETGDIVIGTSPTISHRIGNFSVTQIYDVLTGRDELRFPDNLVLTGRINAVNPQGSKYHIYHNYDQTLYLSYINSDLYLLNGYKKSNIPNFFQLERRQEQLPEKVSFHAYILGKKDNAVFNSEYYLFYSYKTSKEKATVLYILTERNGGFVLSKRVELNNKFIEEDELRARVKSLNSDILFDNATPIQGSLPAYEQIYEPTLPLINITETSLPDNSFDKPIMTFIRALEEKELSHGVGVYKKFDATKVSYDHSALYLKRKNQEKDLRILGELLDISRFSAHETTLFTKEVKLGESKVPARISVIAMDKGFQKGRNSFSLITAISSPPASGSSVFFDTTFFETSFSMPFERFKGCHLIINKKSDHVELVYLMPLSDGETKKTNARSMTGMYARVMKIELLKGKKKDVKKDLSITEIRQTHRISEDNLDISELENHIKFDEDKNAYWSDYSQTNSNDSQYSMLNITSGAKFFPNSSEGRMVKLLNTQQNHDFFFDGFEDEFGFSIKKFFCNKWRIFGKFDAPKVLGLTTDAFKEIENSPPNIFLSAGQVLNEIARSSPRHQVFIISDDHYQEFAKTILYYMFQDKGKKIDFHTENENLAFNGIERNPLQQMDVLKMFDGMKEKGRLNKKSILIGTIDNILNIGVPSIDDKDKAMMLRSPEKMSSETGFAPHLMYLLATEGQYIELEDFKKGKIPEPEIATILISTPAKWNELKSNTEELNKYNVLDSFHVDKRFLAGKWKVWPPKTPYQTKEIKEYAAQPMTGLEKEVFPNLNDELRDLADFKKPAKHKVLLVSRELKPLVKKMLLSRWASLQGKDDFWHCSNPSLELYKLDSEKPTQESVLQNLEIMSERQHGHRALLLAELKDVRNAQRPPAYLKEDAFKISDWVGKRRDTFLVEENSSDSILPHILYLFESEGKKLFPEEFVDQKDSKKEISILLIGEPDEWEALKKDLTIETRFDLIQRFETFELHSPDRETRLELMSQIIASQEIRSLNYDFDATGLGLKANANKAEAEKKLLGYLINRCETLAQQPEISQEVTAAFIKVLAEFRRSLIEDTDLRSTKVIDRSYMERLLSRIFGIPLNLNILPPNDPYRKLSDDRAALKLQEFGYRGPLDLKTQVINTLLAPTRTGNDSARAIPGSIAICGESSTGKTLLFKTVVKMLELKEYQFSNPHDDEASYMIVNVGRITSDKTAATGEIMTLEETLNHINNFLSLPKGFRGHILFDDIHKGDKGVIKGLIKFIQSLFDAEKGMVRVERMAHSANKKPVIEIPVRNIHLWLTLNPTQDQEKIKRFSKNSTPSDMEVVAATLSTEDNNVESSFMMRWGLVLNVSKFPLDAKAPALTDSLRTNARNGFSVQNKLVLVSPSAVNKVVTEFPNSNARDFLAAATSALLHLEASNESLFAVIPKVSSHNEDESYSATGRADAKIESFIRRSTIPMSMQSLEGKLQLLSIMVDTLRTTILESLVNATTQEYRFGGTSDKREAILSPLLHGVTANLIKKDYLPLSVLNLDPFDFINNKANKNNFNELIRGVEPTSFFDVPIQSGKKYGSGIDGYINQSSSWKQDKNRAQVLKEYVDKVLKLINEKYLPVLMRLNSVHDDFPTAEEWLNSLKDGKATHDEENQLENELYQAGLKLADIYLDFWSGILDPNLVENRRENQGKYYVLNTYDTARLYSMIIDRAITRVSWGQITQFMMKGLERATSDMEIGQRPGVLNYLFSSRVSLLRPATHELVLQIANGSQAYKEWNGEKRKKLELEYYKNCKNAFEAPKGSEQ